MLDRNGYPLERGEPEYAEEDSFWDGSRLYHLVNDNVSRRQAVLLAPADVVVLNSMGCCPGTGLCGTKTIAGEKARGRLARAGFVRFAEPDGVLQHWEADDGTTLALLVGEVTRPALD